MTAAEVRNTIVTIVCVLTLWPCVRLLLAPVFPIVGRVEDLAIWSLVGCAVGLVGSVVLPFFASRWLALLAIPAIAEGAFWWLIVGLSRMH